MFAVSLSRPILHHREIFQEEIADFNDVSSSYNIPVFYKMTRI